MIWPFKILVQQEYTSAVERLSRPACVSSSWITGHTCSNRKDSSLTMLV